MPYDNWGKRLDIYNKYKTVAERRAAVAALKINFSQPTADDEGYYRKPITEKHPTNGQNKVVGWIPVAYFLSDATAAEGVELCGVIGAGADLRNMTDREVGDEELWSYVVSNPISYEWYQAVAERGEPWPDQPAGKDPSIIMALETEYPSPEKPREITRDHNNPPELLPEVEHAAAIDNALGAAKDLPVTTVDEAAIALGAANVLRDRRLAAEKVAKAKVDPLHAAYVAERDKWVPMVKKAKDAETKVRFAVSEFEARERRRVAQEQLEALRRQEEIDAAAERAADRQIAAGEPEKPPVVEDVVIPKAPEPVKPTYGSYKGREKPILKWAVIEDMAAALEWYRSNEQVIMLIQKLATHDIRAGTIVPGIATREGTE